MTRRDVLGRGAATGLGALLPLSAAVSPALAAQPVSRASAAVTLTGPLTRYIASAATAAVPADIRQLAKLHLLDTLASAIACRHLEASVVARRYARLTSPEGAEPILGSRETAGPVDAVFASAMTAHAAEINDFIPSAFVQPGPAIVSVALAMARRKSASGTAFLGAMIAGYDVAGRLPKAIGTANLYRAGLANHGVAPTFGAAAAACALLGHSPEQVDHALAYCAQQASGSWQWMLDVRHVEKAFVFAGMGARNGLQAALLVEAGFTGVPASLDAKGGWFRWPAFSGEGSNPGYLVDRLGSRFELPETAFKRYPVGGPTQPAVEALLALRDGLDPSSVERIVVEMPGRWETFRDAAMPALNLRYLASLIMLDGKLDFTAAQSLDRMHNDAAIRAYMTKVEVRHDPAQEAPEGSPRTESARVTIHRGGGTPLSRYVPWVRGFPSHPMSADDVTAKAIELTAPHIGQAGARQLVALSLGIDELPDVNALVELARVA